MAIAPDKSRIYITSGGSEIVTVVDVPRLLNFIHTHAEPYALDLSASSNYVVTRIPVGLNPRGLTLSRDGSKLFVANRLEDTVSVIDTRINRVVSTITLADRRQTRRFISTRALSISRAASNKERSSAQAATAMAVRRAKMHPLPRIWRT